MNLREIASAFRIAHAGCFPAKEGFVLIYLHPFQTNKPEAFGWSLDPKATDYKPGTYAVQAHGNGMLRCTFGGDDTNGAQIWHDMPNAK